VLADLEQMEEFLILFYDQALGTAIHATPVFEALRAARPESRITVAAGGISREVVRNNPFVDRVIETMDGYTQTLAAARAIRRAYRPGRPFCILTAGGSCRSRITLLAMLAGKALRAGYTLAPELYHAPLTPITSSCEIKQNLGALTPLGIAVEQMEPRLFFTAADVDHARELLGDAAGGTAIMVTRTSGGQLTAWPDERFIAVARHLIDTHGMSVLLPGTKADLAAVTQLTERIGVGARAVAGKTTVAELAALCACADIAVTLDTGGLHVARTQTLPLVVIAPAWQDSEQWMPLGRPWARILKGPWFPAPPPPGYALEEISVRAVVEAVDSLLSLYPPSEAARQGRRQRSCVG
jgi:ADP-heptose:LPS heptosyltransferase